MRGQLKPQNGTQRNLNSQHDKKKTQLLHFKNKNPQTQLETWLKQLNLVRGSQKPTFAAKLKGLIELGSKRTTRNKCKGYKEGWGPLEKGTMWSYSKQRQPWQLQKRLQTMLPAASLRHLSGCLPGTVSAFAQHRLFAFESKNLGLSSTPLLLPPRERWGEEEEELILVRSRPVRQLLFFTINCPSLTKPHSDNWQAWVFKILG